MKSMSKPIGAIRFAIAITLWVPAAFAQDASKPSPVRAVTKTLVASEAQKECFSLGKGQRLQYRFSADGPLNFKLSHQDKREVVDFKRDRADGASGSFSPKIAADHCLVWTNAGKHAVTLRYEFQRGP
jgi:hypothetical protein